MTKTAFEDKVGMTLWKLIVGSISALAIMVGAMAWAGSVDNTAKQALKLGEENKIKIDQLYIQLQSQSTSLTEMRVDTKYMLSSLEEIKRKQK